MTIELVYIPFRNTSTIAAINNESGRMEREFTSFLIWLSLNHDTRSNSRTRGTRPAKSSLRQYAYNLKAWFDWIEDWNASLEENDRTDLRINWATANSRHREVFIDIKKLNGAGAVARNQLRTVFKLFYDDFCNYLNLSHSMNSGISTYRKDLSDNFQDTSINVLANYQGKRSKRAGRSFAVQEGVPDVLTVSVVNYDDLNTLISHFTDPVFGFISFLMLQTGLRTQAAINIPYPGSQPKENPYCTDPETLKNDYGIKDFFELNYIYKGHEDDGITYQVDISLVAWESIWTAYKPLLDERLVLWRDANKNQNKKPFSYWLTEKGKPVTAADIQTAFRHAYNCIHDKSNINYNPAFPKFTPRTLRNTYACGIVQAYIEENGLSLNPEDKSSLRMIHEYVQQQLGHKNIETTLRYLRTINKTTYRRLALKLSPKMTKDGKIIGKVKIR